MHRNSDANEPPDANDDVSRGELSPALESLVEAYLASMDHVSILLALREAPPEGQSVDELAKATRLTPAVVAVVIDDLISSNLAQRDGAQCRYTPAAALEPAISELAEFNRTRPVTLVRAVYGRKERDPAQRFADAFRIRPDRS